jgi:predicted Zn-ribbon and HTH transcriptional regulator
VILLRCETASTLKSCAERYCRMGEDEKRELLRDILPDQEPDKIDAARHMLALAWRCDNCGYVTNSKVPIKIPAPCVQCGGTVFRVVNR